MQGQVALITGGGRGIGRVVAQVLAAQGVAVALLGRNASTLSDTVAAIESGGGRALAIPCDVSNGEELRQAVAACQRSLGALTLLVNNAGVGDGGLLWQMDADAWWRVQEVNLKGPFLATHAVLPGMLERGSGRIINVGSFAGNSVAKGGSAYSTSKTALQRLTEGTAADLVGTGVTAFCISPGFVRTEMGRDYEAFLSANDPTFNGMDEDWVFPPEAAAQLCLRLASGEADALSGRFIHVRDDLDRMITDSAAIAAGEYYQLRLRLPEPGA